MRVISGSCRGRPLRVPRGEITRPTPDRAKGAIFSILGSVEGLRVLDLFAGTGALGIEALSRGAHAADFVESAIEPLAALRANLVACSLATRSRVHPFTVQRFLAEMRRSRGTPFDLVFADPPYAELHEGRLAAVLVPVLRALAPEPTVTLVLEHASADPPPELAPFILVQSRKYGTTTASFYERPSLKLAENPP